MEEELIKRILPHSDDAERSVIGCMMMNREAIMIASEILTGDEFSTADGNCFRFHGGII